MPNPTAHYLVTDGTGRVVAWSMRLQHAQAEADAADGRRVVDLYTTDIATLARIAERDDPRLAKVGSGLLGAGTHPAQPYLEYMRGMVGVTRDNVREVTFGYDGADSIVLRFCDNASTWRGDTARAVKAALRAMVAR